VNAPAAWLDKARAEVAADPMRIRALFPAVSRSVGRQDGVDDAARAELLAALPLRGQALVDEVTGLYRFGDAHEKRGVLRALHRLDGPYGTDGIGDAGVPLLLDALRSNDTRLIEAALGPYGVAHLDAAAWRQAVLKCVFTGVPLSAVHGLAERADGELARMLVDFARERVAAGRTVPPDVWLVLDHYPAAVEASDLPAGLRPRYRLEA
jgi:hypothetical protein